MTDLTRYELRDGIATITMDDGKVNALSVPMLGAVAADLDRAEADEAVVILTGRAATLSAGFDLRSDDWPSMLTAGASLARRMLAFPRPVVIACNGHALAMGGFLLLSGDVRIGAAGEHRIGLNEVAIGLTLPWFGVALAEHRLAPPYDDRLTVTGAIIDPEEARLAGFLDRVVAPEEVAAVARATAEELKGINMVAHAATKVRIRHRLLADLDDGIARIGDPDREL